ncbi:helix-turn-helix transcriptional regulator [Shouchella shacheensis]|uniref:helix-turn-helix transcriptional regulator n=1 Tax=Shouchella shacheensis TaxID=1649580 RepID=UPI00073FB71E|nr:LuxR C-terminal-related transcriptional regulator [Shouchella shacheensis]
MLDHAVYAYIKEMANVTDVKTKSEWMMHGCLRFFPVGRASLFTYSPLSYLGEGVLLIEGDRTIALTDVKEDVRPIPPLYQALTRNRSTFVHRETVLSSVPPKYRQSFETSLAIIPISLRNIIVAFVLVDQMIEKGIREDELSLLSQYFHSFFLPSPKKNMLSKRETEVLQHLANGYTIKQMAGLMALSEFTVRDYVSSLMRKLGVNHRAEAVAAGMRKGIIV